MTDEDLIARRARLMGPNVPTFYRDPVEIVRGEGVWLWDSAGRRYLDCYNNVAHVGHCHPHVVAAIARQAGMNIGQKLDDDGAGAQAKAATRPEDARIHRHGRHGYL